jgi:hypothetical protein
MVAARRLASGNVAIPGWLLLVALVTILAGAVETGGQQKLRHGADHPQVEMVRQAVQRLNSGTLPAAVVGTGRVDLVTSPDPWITVTDSRGLPLASSGDLFGLPPIPPSGVFDYVQAHGQDRITWQPAEGVRHAIVVDRYQGGFVLAGRTLSEVERNEDTLLSRVILGWLAGIAAVAGGWALLHRRRAA